MPTVPHVRHTWMWQQKRRAFLCQRCKAMVPRNIVDAAGLRHDMGGLALDELLDRLLAVPLKAAR